ncbi:MAG TPA: hypothetical protein DDY16_04285 [Tenacibaculum sp.]|nr:hypothetical protein [Tenacibaculum sp.]
MLNKICCVFILVIINSHARSISEEFRSKEIFVVNDTIQIDSISIQKEGFKILDQGKKEVIPKSEYKIDFTTSHLIIDKTKYRKIIIEYYRYPDFLTKTYVPFDKGLIVANSQCTGKLYSETTNKKNNEFIFLDGLQTSGFITRGVTTGNNQNAVTNATLDLTLSGKLSDKVGIRANIFDTNFPLQQEGYSQNITDFDRIFIELYNKNWNIRGGDLNLSNKSTYFLNFEKQVSGLEVGAKYGKDLNAKFSGAIVRGRFSVFDFVGSEGNQGPYKIYGTNNESAIIMVEGSERVFVNGVVIEKGENKDYIIDYNLAEIKFNTTYPITNDMRIRIEFQYADRNYTRFITYGKTEYKNTSFSVAGFFYNENDVKNQPVQQNLTDTQKEILTNAGNNSDKMTVQSAFIDEFSINKIQYKKILRGTKEIFEYTTDDGGEVYTVTFTNVGENKGDYRVNETIALGTIYKYVGENLGDFNPVVKLSAPTKLQILALNSTFKPSEKIQLSTELAISDNDQNLFSVIDDQENKKIATKFKWEQQIVNKTWNISGKLNYKFIQDKFQTVQRFQTVEFNRDWNLENRIGNQSELGASIIFNNKKRIKIAYDFQYLTFSNNFSGYRQVIEAKIKKEKVDFWLNASQLSNMSTLRDGSFYKVKSKIKRSFNRSWAGLAVNFESNQRKLSGTNYFDSLSHRFNEVEEVYGIGDSVKVFAKIGFNYRTNDSIKSNVFKQINKRKTFYLKTKLIQNKRTNLSVYANFRMTDNEFEKNEIALNSRVIYNQHFFKNFLTLETLYETTSGNLARQDFVYIETEPGQGYYIWNDYNKDGKQQFDEFEVAQFQDQAIYLRVTLPNIRFIPTQCLNYKQSITLNPQRWEVSKGIRKLISHFFNNGYFSINNEQEKKEKGFWWNPYKIKTSNLLSLSYSVRNNFYYNRNLQRYSWVYTYGKSKNKQQFSVGSQESTSLIHQLNFQHKLTLFCAFETQGVYSESRLQTENLVNRNYHIKTKEIRPKLTFFYNKDHKLSFFYNFKKKENFDYGTEKLELQKLGLSYFLFSSKNQLKIDVAISSNKFSGKINTPVSYQMLEGLQVGNNYTWNLFWNQKLTSMLNLSLNYFGRKSQEINTIHSGAVQLKAIF